jgi:hypothetical protein
VWGAFAALGLIVLVALGAMLVMELRTPGSAAGVAGSVADIVTASLGLVGTLAGLFAGHRLGASGKKKAEDERDAAVRDRVAAYKERDAANKDLAMNRMEVAVQKLEDLPLPPRHRPLRQPTMSTRARMSRSEVLLPFGPGHVVGLGLDLNLSE